jgi:hypothetical protein
MELAHDPVQWRSFVLAAGLLVICHARLLDSIELNGMDSRYIIIQNTLTSTTLNYCQFHSRMITTNGQSLTTDLVTCKCLFLFATSINYLDIAYEYIDIHNK